MGQGTSCAFETIEAAADCQSGHRRAMVHAGPGEEVPDSGAGHRVSSFPGRARTPLSGEDPSTAARPPREMGLGSAPSAGVLVSTDLEQPQPKLLNIKPRQTLGAPPPRLRILKPQPATVFAHKDAPDYVTEWDQARSSQISDSRVHPTQSQCGFATTNSRRDAELLRVSDICEPVRQEESEETNPPSRLKAPDFPRILQTCSGESQPPLPWTRGHDVTHNLPGTIVSDPWRSKTLTQYAARRHEELRAEHQRRTMLAAVSNVPNSVMTLL